MTDAEIKDKAREVATEKLRSAGGLDEAVAVVYDEDDVDLDCDGGCWVQAAIFVSDHELGLSDEPDD